ncbi:MAG: chemotaxis protein CheW [Sphingomonas sp.]|uniref:chemotaxis protein CheW n=1 Tax=Sphingomonas sp. TaxID=28214 RepID=UPI0025E92459|nr:chemotaxis protein CheW [Sphingomonas sp.]MBX9882109.1 chemotaxis protein CheW [Sphingomonas sp.]
MDDLLQEFIAETRETLEALSGEIVMWEAAPSDRQRLDAIFRFVHTVKGSCGFLDLPRLSRLSHAAEDALAAVRAGERVPDTHLVNAVLAIVDRIGEIIEAIDAGSALDDSGEDLLIAALAPGGAGAKAQPQAALASAHQGEEGAVTAPRAANRSVRLSVELLDRMMSGMSEMVLARNELARRLRDQGVEPVIEAALERLSHTVAEMRDTVTRTRMQKIDALFSALPRMVRDTAAEVGKSVLLSIEGADVELDREMIEMMRDPLVHIIRNAIDHGIESPEIRRAAGKREHGRLVVSARQSGNQIIIEIIDDGGGIDTERLIAKYAKISGRSEAELRALPERAKLALVFEPGLSSKDKATSISGRGVGMDVVRANIEQIGGRIELSSTPGKGLAIAIHVPLTLSIISTIVVGAKGQRFALPRQAVEEIVRVRGDAIRIDMLGDTPVATVRDRRLPMIALDGVLGLAHSTDAPVMLAIVAIGGGSYALAVDEVHDTEELVIKPAPPAVMATGLYAGQTLPDTGRPMLLLDCSGLAQKAGLRFGRDALVEEDSPVQACEDTGRTALLFVDLDGQRRAVSLDVVDRVEPANPEAVRFSAGKLRLAIDGTVVPLATLAGDGALDLIAQRGAISVLRMADGVAEIGYPISEALDIIGLTDAVVPAGVPGPISGIVMVDGEPIELLDVHWLFGTVVDTARPKVPPLCLFAGGEARWMENFLRPVLEASGYRVASGAADNEVPAVVLAMEGEEIAARAPVVRLRTQVAPAGRADSIYRYDRAALLAAVAARSGEAA